MSSLEWWELASYVVTVIGLPLAIFVFLRDARRERQNEEEEVYLTLAEAYAQFCTVLLKNADLQLVTGGKHELTPEQHERKTIIYEMLIGIFERAYILIYESDLDPQDSRLWATWNDYIEEWLARPDFRAMLPDLLAGEDPEFVAYMQNKAKINV